MASLLGRYDTPQPFLTAIDLHPADIRDLIRKASKPEK
jgi:hypothetical protein